MLNGEVNGKVIMNYGQQSLIMAQCVTALLLLGLLLGSAWGGSKCHLYKHRHFLDCRRRFLSTVPTENFTADLLGIDLSYNFISAIGDHTFSTLSKLQTLDLSVNKIEVIEPEAFAGLRNLLSLNLSYIGQKFTVESLTVRLFEPLLSLELVRIQGCIISKDWINQSLYRLKNLTTLWIDYPPDFIFDMGFKVMTKLRWISTRERLAGINAKKCEWSTIKNETFLVFREIAIKELLSVQCKIEIIESSAFEPLVSLEVLDLSFNPYLGLSVAFQSLAGLRLNMLAINMRMVNERFTRYKLEDSDFMYISKICVRSVDLSQNNIYYEQKRVFIPVKFRLDCLENLNMSYHTFNFWPSKMLEELRHSTSLTCLDFSHVGSGFQKLSDGLQTSVQFTPCFVLPPNLTWFSISCCKVWIDWWYDLCFGSPTKLRYLGFANLGLMELDKIVSPFVSMTNLQVIDLSSNMLTDLSLELFRETQNLMDVNLADNKLDRLPLALSHLNGLRKLNMSLNLIVYFQSDEIKLVENLISREDKEPRLQIMLSNNPLQCNCETLVFIGWLFRRAEIFDNVDKYKCSLSNGTRLFLKDFRLHLTDFEVKCISNTYLIISVVGILTVLVVVLLLVVIHRYRLNLRYWLCTKLMPPENMFVDQEYLYDAFVAYTSDEYEWVGQQLRPKLELVEDPVRLCIHDRDFIPGKPIHENIVQKMKESRKILLIISPGFLDSTYGPLEIEYAGMKCLEEGRDDVIICVLMEDIPVRQMPRALRNLWHKITFLKWSANLEAQAIFWRNLKGAVSQA